MYKWLKFNLMMISSVVLLMGVAHAATAQSLDHMVAIVNNSIITSSELNQAIHKIKKQLTANHTTLPNEEVLHHQVLEQLINRKLQLDIATEMGVKVTDQEIDKAIQSIATNNRVTMDQLYHMVALQGLTRADYRTEIREEYTIHKVQQRSIGGKISVSPDEVDDFLRSAAWVALNAKEYHLEDILITLPEAPSTEQMLAAKKRAAALMTKLHQGISFREAAVAESGSTQALQGGDLGWRKLPEIPSAFSNLLLQAKDNDILGPIQTPNGFHIIHVAGIRTVGMQGAATDQRKKVQELLYDRKYEEALQTWITKIRSEAFINTHLEG